MHHLQDLDYLSEGLEGRCQSPVALLFDALLRPDTDFGGTMESVLTWKHQKERAIPHVVLGRNLPGGAWHVSGGWERVRRALSRIYPKSWGDSFPRVRTLPFPDFPYSLPLLLSHPLLSLPLHLPFLQPPQLRPPMSFLPTGPGAQRGLDQRAPFAHSPLKAPW